jgi:glutamate 5-kinase
MKTMLMEKQINRSLYIGKIKRVVLKLGTKVLLAHHRQQGALVDTLIEDIAQAMKHGTQFIIVTSGAVGLGMQALNLSYRPKHIMKVQALASIGQSQLMQTWIELFTRKGLQAGQVLLTYDVIENRKRFLHVRNCLHAMAEYGLIPVINENDSVAVDELKFGDNDNLSSLVASIIEADLLVLFTDTDGFFTDNPKKNCAAAKISFLDAVNDDLYAMVQDKGNAFSLGGMTSKLKAAGLAAKSGAAVVIADGLNPRLKEILAGEDVGTFIKPGDKFSKDRKKWIFFNQRIKGRIIVDQGAENALLKNCSSLLPKGVLAVVNQFDEGSIVGIFNEQEQMIGKGITHYSGTAIDKIKGKNSLEIRSQCQNFYFEEIIHRDNMIVWPGVTYAD